MQYSYSPKTSLTGFLFCFLLHFGLNISTIPKHSLSTETSIMDATPCFKLWSWHAAIWFLHLHDGDFAWCYWNMGLVLLYWCKRNEIHCLRLCRSVEASHRCFGIEPKSLLTISISSFEKQCVQCRFISSPLFSVIVSFCSLAIWYYERIIMTTADSSSISGSQL